MATLSKKRWLQGNERHESVASDQTRRPMEFQQRRRVASACALRFACAPGIAKTALGGHHRHARATDNVEAGLVHKSFAKHGKPGGASDSLVDDEPADPIPDAWTVSDRGRVIGRESHTHARATATTRQQLRDDAAKRGTGHHARQTIYSSATLPEDTLQPAQERRPLYRTELRLTTVCSAELPVHTCAATWTEITLEPLAPPNLKQRPPPLTHNSATLSSTLN